MGPGINEDNLTALYIIVVVRRTMRLHKALLRVMLTRLRFTTTK